MVTTFLPYVSFEESLSVLDNRYLGKQRVEAMQIINAIHRYHDEGSSGRGYNNNMKHIELDVHPSDIEMPWYIGWDHFHKSHQASLLRKHPIHYNRKFRQEECRDKGDYSINR